METKEIIVNGFDLIALNREYAELLRKHENDTDVQGESREHFLNFGDAKDETDMIKYHASICNAWDELCSKHEGLRDSGLSWYAGAQWTEYPANLWDIYIGTGDELDKQWD